MNYQFDFTAVLDDLPLIGRGVLFTLVLTAVGAVFGIGIGIVGAVCRAWKLKPFDHAFAVYVEAIRNTPFLVQLFFIFFGLPGLGVKLDDWQAAALTMVINLGAYCTEIIRSGVQATPRGQIEAAQALAMTRGQIFRNVVMRPALQKVWPSIASRQGVPAGGGGAGDLPADGDRASARADRVRPEVHHRTTAMNVPRRAHRGAVPFVDPISAGGDRRRVGRAGRG